MPKAQSAGLCRSSRFLPETVCHFMLPTQGWAYHPRFAGLVLGQRLVLRGPPRSPIAVLRGAARDAPLVCAIYRCPRNNFLRNGSIFHVARHYSVLPSGKQPCFAEQQGSFAHGGTRWANEPSTRHPLGKLSRYSPFACIVAALEVIEGRISFRQGLARPQGGLTCRVVGTR
jgi:hypothetical protein